MAGSQRVMVACEITRSAFSGERIVKFRQANGEEYVGAAPVEYCRTSTFRRLEADDPTGDESINGFVEAYLVKNGGDLARVSLPDGEGAEVNVGEIRVPKTPRADEEFGYVSLGS